MRAMRFGLRLATLKRGGGGYPFVAAPLFVDIGERGHLRGVKVPIC